MKILSLDGGGVFGFVQARITSEAQAVDKFDMYAGTSIGSTIAGALAIGTPVDQSFFDIWMPKIFDSSIWRKINIFKSKYSDKILNRALKETFSTHLFGEAKKPLFVTAANVKGGCLKVFGSVNACDFNYPMWEVLRSAVAGETYFDPYKNFSDGGVFANNPAMVAIAAANHVLHIPIEDIELLSIGTGNRAQSSYSVPTNLLGWGKWVIDASLTGSANSMHEYFADCMPLKKFVRIQFPGKPNWKLDDIDAMKIAEKEWEPNIIQAIDIVKNF